MDKTAALFNVFVGNLSWSTTNEDLKTFFRSSGNLVGVEVQLHDDTRRSKGWGLASFDNKESAERAVRELNLTELDGRTVHVRVDRNYKSVWDEEEDSNLVPVFVGNIPWSLSKEDLVAYFRAFHPVTSNLLTNMYGKSRGFAIINFRNESDAEGAIATMNGMEINGRVIECRFDRGPDKKDKGPNANTSVFVGKLDKAVGDDELAAMFAHIGGICSASVKRHGDNKSKKWGIVEFVDVEYATLAVTTMNGVPHGYKNIPLKVRLDRK